jgi:hypothetical protein
MKAKAKKKKKKVVDSVYMAKIGSKGGKANSSESLGERSRSAWAKLSDKQRSNVMKERAKIRAKRKKELEKSK